MAWDCFIDVRGNRYSVPSHLVNQSVSISISLDGALRIYDPRNPDPEKLPVATHFLRDSQTGWAIDPRHHQDLWRDSVKVDQRPLSIYQEVTQWS